METDTPTQTTPDPGLRTPDCLVKSEKPLTTRVRGSSFYPRTPRDKSQGYKANHIFVWEKYAKAHSTMETLILRTENHRTMNEELPY